MKWLITALLISTSVQADELLEVIRTDKLTIYAVTDTYTESRSAGSMLYRVFDREVGKQADFGVVVRKQECIANYKGVVWLLDGNGTVTEHNWDGKDLRSILGYQAMLVCDIIKSRVSKLNVHL